jgi:hypothetical protein
MPDRVHARAFGLDLAAIGASCLIFALVLFLPQVLNDSDTLWQIRTGGWILEHRAIPATDPFSFTARGRPWFAHEWLAEVLMAAAYRTGGMQGVMALAACATGLTAGVLLHHLRRFLPNLHAITALIVALGCAAPSMLARPHLIAWPCLALWCGGLVTARANRAAPSLLLLPVMVLWVNLHGSFMLGLLLAGAFLVEALFDPGIRRRRVFIDWGGFVLAACAVALLNPEFFAGVLFPIRLVGMTSLGWIGEWAPPDFSRLQPVEIVILGCLALGFTGKVVVPPVRLLLLIGLVHGALAHARNQQLLGMVGVLILAAPLGASLGRGHGTGPVWRWLPVGGALIAAVALAVHLALPLSVARTGAAFAVMLDTVPASLRAQPVLNEYGLGGQLIFNGVRPFIDSRADLYGDAFLARYHRLISPDPAELRRTLAEYRIAWTIFPAGHPIVPLMDGLAGWRRLAEADGIVIHARDDR